MSPATGEGGMVISDNEEFIEKVKMLRNHGQVARYDHATVGYNLRLTSMAAAIGREQLKKLDMKTNIRRRNARLLTEGLKDIPGIEPPFVADGNDPVFHQYTIKVIHGRDEISKGLNEREIGNKIFYPTTITSSPALKEYARFETPIAEDCAKRVLSLPVHPLVSEEDVKTIINSIKEIVEGLH
jgi:perosamine synthetase